MCPGAPGGPSCPRHSEPPRAASHGDGSWCPWGACPAMPGAPSQSRRSVMPRGPGSASRPGGSSWRSLAAVPQPHECRDDECHAVSGSAPPCAGAAPVHSSSLHHGASRPWELTPALAARGDLPGWIVPRAPDGCTYVCGSSSSGAVPGLASPLHGDDPASSQPEWPSRLQSADAHALEADHTAFPQPSQPAVSSPSQFHADSSHAIAGYRSLGSCCCEGGEAFLWEVWARIGVGPRGMQCQAWLGQRATMMMK